MKRLATSILLAAWTLALAVPATSLWVPAADAQQVVEIDYTTGRTIDDEWRAMRPGFVAVDWERSILHVLDAEEPEGIMAFSLETGEWLRTVSTPLGEGPQEFTQGHKSVAIGPNGGLFVAGFVRIIEYSPQGVPVNTWTPEVPVPRKVCNFGSSPAVPTQGGVVLRGSDGTSIPVGPVRARGRNIAPGDDFTTARETPRIANIACTDDVAYVLVPRTAGEPSSLFAYHLDGKTETLVVPAEDARRRSACMFAEERRRDGSLIRPERPCPHWSLGARLSLDERGNVVVLSTDTNTLGAVIDPVSGCYALIRGTHEHPHALVGVHADSVLVFRRPFEVTEEGGDTFLSISNTANGVSLHPLRHVSGELCPGMLLDGRSVGETNQGVGETTTRSRSRGAGARRAADALADV